MTTITGFPLSSPEASLISDQLETRAKQLYIRGKYSQSEAIILAATEMVGDFLPISPSAVIMMMYDLSQNTDFNLKE